MQLHSPAATSQPPVDRYVDDAEAADLLSVSRSYLRQLRCKGGGPVYSTFGRAVRYRIGDLFAWAGSKKTTSTSDRAA